MAIHPPGHAERESRRVLLETECAGVNDLVQWHRTQQRLIADREDLRRRGIHPMGSLSSHVPEHLSVEHFQPLLTRCGAGHLNPHTDLDACLSALERYRDELFRQASELRIEDPVGLR